MRADNIDYDFATNKLTVEKSPLPYNLRRKFGTRLKRLHAYLGTLKPRRYEHSKLVTTLTPEAPACGTVACAFGHAVTSGKFKGIPAKVKVDRGAKPDENGRLADWQISFKPVKRDINRELRANGFTKHIIPSYGDPAMQDAADAYFGPGAWTNIFGIMLYADDGRGQPTLSTVRKRIKAVASGAYGVKFD